MAAEFRGLKNREGQRDAECGPEGRQPAQESEIGVVDIDGNRSQAWLYIIPEKGGIGDELEKPFELRMKNENEKRKQYLDCMLD